MQPRHRRCPRSDWTLGFPSSSELAGLYVGNGSWVGVFGFWAIAQIAESVGSFGVHSNHGPWVVSVEGAVVFGGSASGGVRGRGDGCWVRGGYCGGSEPQEGEFVVVGERVGRHGGCAGGARAEPGGGALDGVQECEWGGGSGFEGHGSLGWNGKTLNTFAVLHFFHEI